MRLAPCVLLLELASCSLRIQGRSRAAEAQADDYVYVDPSDLVLYDVNREGEAVARAKDMFKWAVKKTVSNALKGASFAVFSFATIAGISAVVADCTANAVSEVIQPTSFSRAELPPTQLQQIALIRPCVYRALHIPLRCMHHVSLGFLVASDSIDNGETDQLSDLARISVLTRGNSTAYVAALEAAVAERRAAGMVSDRLESCLMSYRHRLSNSGTFIHRTIPGLAEGD